MPPNPALHIRVPPGVARELKILAAQRGETAGKTLAWLLSQENIASPARAKLARKGEKWEKQ